MYKYGIILSFFTVVLTSITAFINNQTNPVIYNNVLKQKKIFFDQLIPKKNYDNDLLENCYVVKDHQLGKGKHRIYIARNAGNPIGVIMETTVPDGYSGKIQLLVSCDFCGNIWGVRVLEHHETPGLGDKIELRLSDWILYFSDKVIRNIDDSTFAVKKDGGNFDQFTGATITPRAVVNAVKKAVLYAKTLPSKIDILPACKNYS